MVNSLSRPKSRPVAPPVPVDGGGMTPLWHRETCLPAHRPPVRNQTKSNQIKPCRTLFAPFAPFVVHPPPPQSRQKPLQSCIIKAYQGIRLKMKAPPHRRAIPTRHAPSPPSLYVGRSMLDVGCWMLDVGCWMFRPAAPSAFIRVHLRSNPPFRVFRAFRGSTSLAQSRQKPQQSCLIKAYQGIRLKMKAPLIAAPPQPATRLLLRHWMLGVRCWMLDVSARCPICVCPRPSYNKLIIPLQIKGFLKDRRATVSGTASKAVIANAIDHY